MAEHHSARRRRVALPRPRVQRRHGHEGAHLRQRRQLGRPDHHLAARHVPAHGRHRHQPTRDRWVHGGSFHSGDRTSAELVDEANTFAKEGYVNVSIDYRLESPGCSGSFSNCVVAIQEAAADAQTAVRFLRTHASTYGIDPTRIAIGGSSAGAITALNVGYSSSEDPSASVRAAVSLSGAQLAVGTIAAGDAPALDFHCTTDPLVAYQSALNTSRAPKAPGLDMFLESWNETCHVPYAEHRQQILDQTQNFLYWEMNLAHAAT